jgi:hypothetical protein
MSADKKLDIVNLYLSIIHKGVSFPSRNDLLEVGVPRDTLRHYFGNIAGLREAAKLASPSSFKGVIDLNEYLSDKRLLDLGSKIKKYKKFFITTAVSGQKVHKGFLNSIKRFCAAEKALLLILPSHDTAHNLDNDVEWHFDKTIDPNDHNFVFEDTYLNENLLISGIRVTAKQINPVTGLSELSQSKGSCIFASPKQSLEYDAVSSNRLPHARRTTGAVTMPNYKTSRGNSLRTAYIAQFQHILGGLVIEIQDKKTYHCTEVQADEFGSFCHLGIQYSANTSRQVRSTFVMGDLHAGQHDEKALQAWKSIINKIGCYQVVFHDTFDGTSISHHTEHDIMVRASLSASKMDSLEDELRITRDILDSVLDNKKIKSGIIVKSNHDDFIDRWLSRGGFVKDPKNFAMGCKLAAEVVNTEKDILETGLKIIGQGKCHGKLKFLGVNDDFMVGDVNCGAHGDRSANGSRGSIKSLAKSFAKGVFGHSHTPGIFKNARQIGTTSKLRQGYNKGPSSWVHCSAIVYDNGQVQLINAIEGKTFSL